MNLFRRLKRKIADVLKYPALAWERSDRHDLWILGLSHNRLISRERAAKLTVSRSNWTISRLKITRGERIRVDLANSAQVDTFDELFVHQIYDLNLVVFQPDLVVDCGAFCGYFSAMATGWFPKARMVAFEANPANWPDLEQQLSVLGRSAELVKAAVWNLDGEIEFAGDGVGGSICSPGQRAAHRVPAVDFGRWIQQQKPQRLVWKLDVEGAELQVLPSLLECLPHETVIYLETHYPDAVCKSLLEPYERAGFRLAEVRRRAASGGDYCYVEWVLSRA